MWTLMNKINPQTKQRQTRRYRDLVAAASWEETGGGGQGDG